MLRSYSTAGIFHRGLRMRGAGRDRDLNCSSRGSEAQRVLHEIAHGPAKEHWIGIDITFAGTCDNYALLLGDRFIECRDFLDRGAAIEKRQLDMPFSGFGAGQK